MISLVGLALSHHSHGRAKDAQQILDTLPDNARFQIELRFDEVQAICHHRFGATHEPRNGNCVAIETYVSIDRCLLQSPDGRGAVWYLSGGHPAAYGSCSLATCPLARNTPKGE